MDAPLTSILSVVLEQHVGKELTEDLAARIGAEVLRRAYPGPIDTNAISPLTVGSYVIAPVRLRAVLDDVKELHKSHWEETEAHRHDLTLNPDYTRGLDLEMQGRYLLIAAIHMETMHMVGNYGLYLGRSMHTQTMMASEDTLYVLPEHRRGRLGLAMIRYAERALQQLGVRELNVSVKLVNEVGQMIERLGYKPVGTQYTKILEEVANVRA